MSRKRKYRADFVEWMNGFCSAFEDFSDGAWQAACENAVEVYNKQYGTHYDPYKGWMHWVEHTMVTK